MQPPKTKDHPLFGSLPAFRRDLMGFIHRKRVLHGDVFRINSRFFNAVAITDAAAAQQILQTNHRAYGKSRGYRIMAEFLGQGLLTSDGAYWMRQRRIAQPAFHRQQVARLAEEMLAVARAWVPRWRTLAQSGQVVDMAEEMSALTMEIAARTLFSADVGGRMEDISRSVLMLNQIAIDIIRKPLLRFRKRFFPWTLKAFQRAADTIDGIVYELIRERRAKQGAAPVAGKDLLDLLMEAVDEETGERMTDLQIRDEVVTLFLAGHETSANALAWTWWLLSQHPACAQRLREEVAAVCPDGDLRVEQLSGLGYTRALVNESLRLYPPGWVIGRRTLSDDTLAGYDIPAGTNLLINVFEIHRHERYWQEPEAFRPERFLPGGEAESVPKFAYFPFGGGPRLCIGQQFALYEIAIVLAVLAREFHPAPADGAIPQPQPLITLRPGGMNMRVETYANES